MFSGKRTGERQRAMGEQDNQQRGKQVLQRVRCSQCRTPLVQLYQGEVPYTLQSSNGEITTHLVSAYSYRTLTDPTPLLSCPKCDSALSSAVVTAVNSIPLVTKEKEEANGN